MKISIRSLAALLGLSVVAATCSLGCSGGGDMSSNDTPPKAASTTGQHSPPPMVRKAGMVQPGGGTVSAGKAMNN